MFTKDGEAQACRRLEQEKEWTDRCPYRTGTGCVSLPCLFILELYLGELLEKGPRPQTGKKEASGKVLATSPMG